MYTIKTLDDISALSERNTTPKSFIDHLETYFLQLRENLTEDEQEVEFSLVPYGYIAILEPEDDVRDLSSIGLNPQDDGLLGSCPEFVNTIQLEDITLYQIGVLYDNEYMMILYSKVGQFDPLTEDFLKEYASDCIVVE